jgi:hypothetical protein
VGPRAGLYAVEKKNLAPAWNQTPFTQLVARHYTDWATPAGVRTSNTRFTLFLHAKLFSNNGLMNMRVFYEVMTHSNKGW